jgi:hypothetical protein
MAHLGDPRPTTSELAQGALVAIEHLGDEMDARVAVREGDEHCDRLRAAIATLRDRARHLAANVEKLSGWGGGGAGLQGGNAGESALAGLAHLLVRTQDAAALLTRSPPDVAAATDLLTAPEPWPVRLREREERALLTANGA